ncbi:MAG: hypothetical protein Q8P22_08235 [Chloroflexota bacterium]|nr:hypothetical protein [Chloroflexota bacterium]
MEDGLGLVRDFAIIMAVVGGALLPFGIGLEFGWQRIRRVGLQVLLIGIAEVAFMMAVGYQVGKSLGWSEREAVFLGAAPSPSAARPC